MKKLTCSQFGGPTDCSAELSGEAFEEMGNASHAHVMDQIEAGDEAHQEAVQRMQDATPEEQGAMMTEFEKRFNDAEEV